MVYTFTTDWNRLGETGFGRECVAECWLFTVFVDHDASKDAVSLCSVVVHARGGRAKGETEPSWYRRKLTQLLAAVREERREVDCFFFQIRVHLCLLVCARRQRSGQLHMAMSRPHMRIQRSTRSEDAHPPPAKSAQSPHQHALSTRPRTSANTRGHGSALVAGAGFVIVVVVDVVVREVVGV